MEFFKFKNIKYIYLDDYFVRMYECKVRYKTNFYKICYKSS